MPDAESPIFISYTRADRIFVDKLDADLRGRGLHSWVDRVGLEGGQNWIVQIQQEIDRCLAVVVALSPQACESMWVRKEYHYALSRRKLVIPLLVQPLPVMPFALADLEAIDFIRSYDAGLERLLRALPRATSGRAARSAGEATLAQRLRRAMERFSTDMETPTQVDLLAGPLAEIREAITDILFAGTEASVSLAVRRRQPNGTIALRAQSLTSGGAFGERLTPTLPYPDSLAAWSLIQGEPLISPLSPAEAETPVDYAWLRFARKLEVVETLLTAASLRGANAMHAALLRTRLQAGTLTLGDIDQPPAVPARSGSTLFVPIPLRPLEAAGGPAPREMGVLGVSIPQSETGAARAVFDADQLDRLGLVSGTLGLLFASARALHRVPAAWSDE